MKAFGQHLLFEFRAGIRNRQLLLMNYLFPLGFYVLMGLVMTAVNPMFSDTMVPAMVVFGTMSATLLGIPDPLVNARENGIFRSYRINGVPSISILTIPILTTALHMVIVTVVIAVTGPLFFGARTPANWLAFVAVFLSLAAACAGLSVLIGVVSPSSRLTVLYSQLLFVPSMILGGLMLPYSMLPEAARRIALLLPATYAMNAFSGLAMGDSSGVSPWGAVAVLALTGLLSILMAVRLFRWDSRSGRAVQPLLALLAMVPAVVGAVLWA